MPVRYLILLVCLLAAPLAAQLELNPLFTDGMVMQRNSTAPIWGRSTPGSTVSVTPSWSDATIRVRTDDAGRFRAALPTPGAGGPHTIQVQGPTGITIRDVLIGEVWICGGQSNMEWPLRDGIVEGAALARERADLLPRIRLFNVDNAVSTEPKETTAVTGWKRCSSTSAEPFSAIGYFFGRRLHADLGVPIGLIGCNWGGTVAEAWMSENAVKIHGGFSTALEEIAAERRDADLLQARYEESLTAWRRQLADIDPARRGNGWQAEEVADADWTRMTLPGLWDDMLDGFDGEVWFRKTIDVPADMARSDLLLELGAVDDEDTTWVNGVRVGGFERPGYWQTKREYTVPASVLKPGRNVICVRAFDTGGAGGFTGEPEGMRLSAKDDADKSLPLAGPWRYRQGLPNAKMPSRPRKTVFHHNSPTALYNGMLATLAPFAIRGAIFYQGESNHQRAQQYRTLFPAMITDWRRAFEQESFPFYFVQIAPYRYGTNRSAGLREAQMMAMATPNTGMVSLMDLADLDDIHPKKKREVGERLAAWALAKTYGRQGITFSGPIPRSHVIEGDTIRVRFDHVGSGLVIREGPPEEFVIAGADGAFVTATVAIDGDDLVFSGVKNPKAARYAFTDAPRARLFNREGLPASSFRTDTESTQRK